jgi:peptidyl-tRNA hydrolase, PTH2 family
VEDEPKMVLVVRTDLGMGRGKIAAQVAHAAVTAALQEQGTAAFVAWSRAGQPKVVLKIAGETELTQLCAQAHAAGLPVQVIRDAGRTQIVVGTMTCCAIGPAYSDDVDRVTASLALL